MPDGLEGERVDVGARRGCSGCRGPRPPSWSTTGAVLVDGEPAGQVRPGARAAPGSRSTLPEPRDRGRRPSPSAVAGLRIVYDDDDIVVVDKPVGVAAHPSPGWTGPTVIGGPGRRRLPDLDLSGAAERQGVVHRLDVGTTGLMVVAKSERAYTALKRAFRERTVDKRYHALVQGHPDPTRGTIDAPIDRHPTHDYKWAVVAGGRPSVTHYDTLEAFRAASLLEIQLETGRTHQIRVHMAALRHPCVGDLTYGADPTLAARLGLTGSGCTPSRSASSTRPTAARCASPARRRRDLSPGAATCLTGPPE